MHRAMKLRTITSSVLLALLTATAACGGTASLADLEKLKTEACACKDKACADKVSKKAEGMLTDDTIKKHGEKGMEVAFGVAMCLAQHQAQ